MLQGRSQLGEVWLKKRTNSDKKPAGLKNPKKTADCKQYHEETNLVQDDVEKQNYFHPYKISVCD